MNYNLMLLKWAMILIFLLVGISAKIYCREPILKNVLIIYDSPNVLSSIENDSETDFSFLFSQQLGHFKTSVERIKESEYQGGLLEEFDYIFYLSLRENKEINRVLLEDILKTDKTVIWYGEGAEQLINKSVNLPLRYDGTSYYYKQVEYQNRVLNISGYAAKNLLIKPLNNSVKGYGTVSNGIERYPLIINYRNYWLMTGVDTYGLKYLVFSNVLHEILNEEHQKERKVYLRIEDIHPRRSAEKLIKIADYLAGQGVPFMVVVIPVYIDPQSNQEISLNSEIEVLKALKYMVSKGGSIVQHGYSHQYYQNTTGEGFEFWDSQKDQPLNLDYRKYVYDRVTKGLNILTECGLYPLAFIPPHYAMTRLGYCELKNYFSTIIGQIQTSDRRFNSASLPYAVRNTDLFNRVMSESLGYIEINKEKQSLEMIMEKADELSLIRDVETGVFFHPFINIEYLAEIVSGLRDMGYTFADLQDEKNWVNVSNIKIKNFKGVIHRELAQSGTKTHTQQRGYLNLFTRILTFILSILVLVIVVFLIRKYYRLSREYNRMIFEEETYK